MSAADVLSWTRAVPFRPFRLHLASGKTYDIRHPEMLRVGRSALHVYSFAGEPADPFEHVEMASLVLLERVEPLETAAPAPPGNGAQGPAG